MAITRIQLETILTFRRGKGMTSLGLDGVTKDGTNADLTDSIASAIRYLGGSVTDPTMITDADLTTVPADLENALFDASEMYLVNAMRSQTTVVDQVTGPFQAKLSQYPDRLLKDWQLLHDKLEEDFGIGGAELQSGIIEQNFAAHGDSTTNQGDNDSNF